MNNAALNIKALIATLAVETIDNTLTGWTKDAASAVLDGGDYENELALIAHYVADDRDEMVEQLTDDVWEEMERIIQAALDASTVTAVVTGRGDESSVPDNETAVDADVVIETPYAYNNIEGSVTLLADHTDELVAWGSIDMWSGDALHSVLGFDGVQVEVVGAVNGAANS